MFRKLIDTVGELGGLLWPALVILAALTMCEQREADIRKDAVDSLCWDKGICP